LDRAVERYILTVFALGCNLGPAQAARHMAGLVSSHTLSFINQRLMSVDKLDASRRELIELYLQLELPKVWGDGKTVAADGTQYDFYEQNLLAGYHFRYRKMGAVAYRHVADNYIAYFAHFLPPGIGFALAKEPTVDFYTYLGWGPLCCRDSIGACADALAISSVFATLGPTKQRTH
jgi:Tn3 transposase DDE domain